MILDVGCGDKPSGDVNIDIYKKDSPETTRPYNAKNYPNFVQASGCYLPFRNEVFEIVYSNNSMEHTSEYSLFFKEMLRVSNNAVIIQVPHILRNIRTSNPYHKQHFTRKWFRKSLVKLGFTNFQIEYVAWRNYPHQLIPLVRVPTQILVKIFKIKRVMS